MQTSPANGSDSTSTTGVVRRPGLSRSQRNQWRAGHPDHAAQMATYEQLLHCSWEETRRVAPEYFQRLAFAVAQARGRVLEIGCGSGNMTRWLAASPDVTEVVAVDAFPEAIERLQRCHLPKVKPVLTPMEELALPVGPPFDTVVLCEVLEHIYPEEEEAFRQRLVSHIHARTRFIVSTPIGWLEDPHHTRGFTPVEFANHLATHYGLASRLDTTSGYSQVALGTLGNGQNVPSPRVSVILPSFNHAKFLPGAIASVLAQTFTDFELIIVDDGSTDGTREYLSTVTDPRVRVIHQSNQRLPMALNNGFQIARGELFTWTSADNYCAPIFLEALVAALDAHPDAALASGAFAFTDAVGRIRQVHRVEDLSLPAFFPNNPGVAAFLYRRHCRDTVGTYEPALNGAEDWDMWLRIVERHPVVAVPELLYYYREHGDSMSSQIPKDVVTASRRVIDRALERRKGTIDLQEFYPAIADCADRELAATDAALDFGIRLIRSHVAPPELAARFLATAFERRPDARSGAHLMLAFARCGDRASALQLAAHLRTNEQPQIRALVELVIQETDPNSDRLRHFPLPGLRPEESELLRCHAARRRVFSFTASGEPFTAAVTPPPLAAATTLTPPVGTPVSQPSAALEATIREALAIRPEGVEAWQLLAGLHIQRKDWCAGTQAGQRLLQLDPNNVKSLMLLAHCLLGGGDGETAMLVFQRVLTFEPGNELARACLADLSEPEGEPATEAEAYARAERNVRQVLHLEPDNLPAHRLLANVLVGQGRWAEALPPGNRVLAAEPNDTDIRALVASCHWQLGAQTTAALLFEEVEIAQPENAALLDWKAKRGAFPGPAGQPTVAASLGQRKVAAAASVSLAEPPKRPMKFPESRLAHQYLDGLEGLEIGGSAHNPFGLKCRNVDYTADLTTVHKLEEIKLCGAALPVDIVAPGDALPLADGSQDFVISSHVIEHFFDPIKAIKEWLRVIRPGGYVFIIAPHKERTFDKERPRTPLTELLDRHTGKIPPPAEDTHHHYTVWTTVDLVELSQHFNWNVVEFQDADDKVGNGFTLVIQKAPKPVEQALNLNSTGGEAVGKMNPLKRQPTPNDAPTQMPLVSVIVPTFNRPDRLAEALQSILKQTYRNFEIIVVNDAGAEVAEVVAAHNGDGRIRLVTHPVNKGLAGARNTGVRAAQGKYLAYLDDDDLFHPTHLETLVTFLADKPGTVAYTDAHLARQVKVDGQWQVTSREVPYSHEWDNDRILVDNFVPVLCFMHEKVLLEKAGDFDESLRRHEDWDLWIRLSRHFPFAHIPKITCEFSLRDDASSMTGQSLTLFLDTMQRIHAKHAAHAAGRPDLLAAQAAKRDDLQELAQATPKFKVGFMTLDPKVTACAYLRLTAPLNYLQGRRQLEHLAVCDLVNGNLTTDMEKLRQVQVLVVQRGMATGVPYHILRAAFPPSVRLVFELDDALTLLPPNHGAFNHFQSVRPQLEEYLRSADLVTVSTPKLKELYSGFSEHIEVLPNAIDTEIWKPLPPRVPRDGKVRILFSGTLTHQHDLALVEPAIERVAREFPDRVEFLFWGNAPARLNHLPQVRTVAEFTNDYRTYAQLLQTLQIDLALVPLELTAFNRAKSAIKWLEYSACRIPAIFTDIEAYQQTVHHGTTGWLVPNTPDAWYDAMQRLIVDDALRIRIGDAAHETVMSSHTLKQLAPLWVQAYERALARPVTKPAKPEPLVSIVIPTFNNLPLTRQCLDSILGNTPQGLYEVVVVDNGSTDGTPAFLSESQSHGRLRFISNPGNLGFAHACNQGAAVARGKFVLFLNNDTIVTSGWASALLATAQRPKVGVVGAKLLYPDGTIQHAGIGWIKGVPDHPHRHSPSQAPEVNTPRDLDMVTGACFLMPRDLFLSLGGFDEVYRNGVEDIDLCLRVRAAGRTVCYQPTCVVFHLEGKSAGRFDHVSENLKKFASRWHGWFDKDYRFLAPNVAKTIRAEISRLNPSRGAGLPATASHKLELNWLGSFLDYGSLSNINRVLTDALVIQNGAAIRRVQTSAVTGKLAKPLQSYRGKLAAKPNPNATLTVRHAWPPDWSRPLTGKLAVIQPWEFGALPKDWVVAAQNVDAFWVPSNYVRQVYIDSGVPAEKVHVVPNGIDPKVFQPNVTPLKLATNKSFKFLFVGGTIHRKGPDVLLQAYVESFTAKDDVCLVIKDFGGQSVYAGQTLEQQIRELQKQPNAPELLYLNQELAPQELPGLYTACDCLVHPYRGEGFGLPVLEAMACGRPVIVTAGGATDDFVPAAAGYHIPSVRKVFGREISGMPLVADGWLLEPDAGTLKQLLRHVAVNRDEARAKGKFASTHAREHWTWNHTANRLAELAQQCAAGCQPAALPASGKRPLKQPLKIELPAVAKLGFLGPARELLKQNKFVPAWNAALAALTSRPCHPEALLLLAEIAWNLGDGGRMTECVDRALALAPNWPPTRNFLKAHPVTKKPSQVALAPLPPPGVPRLSVCLIAKNEEKFLGQCLASVKDIAHQIVVVDTGSTDRTVAIAKAHGAEVHSFTWCDDFSAARNAALTHATGDWVLVLDADEELAAAGKPELLRSLAVTNAISWRLPIVDHGKEAEGGTYVPRLFRNAPGLFYISRVHEQVFSSVEVRREEWRMASSVGTAPLIHHGYTAEVLKDRNKVARNLRLLELAVEELPGEPNLLMNLGLELIRSERMDEGMQRYAEAFTALNEKPANEITPELRESLLTQYTSHLMKHNRWQAIIAVLTSGAASREPLSSSLHFTLGLAYQELHRWAEAVEQFRNCLDRRGEPSFYLVNRVILGGAPRHCLALALWKSGAIAEAAKEFTTALNEDPTLAPLRMDAARFQIEHGEPIAALQLLHGLVAENSAFVDAWLLGARLALSQPDFIEFARDWTREAIQHHPTHRELIAARGETLLLTQQYVDALPFWRQLNGHPRALSARLHCELMQGEFSIDGPPANEAEVSQEFLNWYRRLIQFRAADGVATVGERLEMLALVLPSAARALGKLMEQVGIEAA